MKKHFNFKKTAMVGAFSGALLGVAVAASAQTTLRIGDSLPSGHYIAEGLIEFWMDEVKDQLGDDIDFDHFPRSEEHTSELQSRGHLVCRLLLEKKKDT